MSVFLTLLSTILAAMFWTLWSFNIRVVGRLLNRELQLSGWEEMKAWTSFSSTFLVRQLLIALILWRLKLGWVQLLPLQQWWWTRRFHIVGKGTAGRSTLFCHHSICCLPSTVWCYSHSLWCSPVLWLHVDEGLKVINSWQSLVYRWILWFQVVAIWLRGLMYIKKRSGLNIEPCAPHTPKILLQNVSLMMTDWLLSVKYDFSQSSTVPLYLISPLALSEVWDGHLCQKQLISPVTPEWCHPHNHWHHYIIGILMCAFWTIWCCQWTNWSGRCRIMHFLTERGQPLVNYSMSKINNVLHL